MKDGITRRVFLATAGATLAMPRALLAKEEVPPMLDHILLGTSDLDAGIAFVEKHTGLRAAFGGVHPGRGTRNALLSLGERRYLEIIAPDPEQAGAADLYGLRALSAPRLITWAVHPASIEEQAGRLRSAGIVFDGPTAGARKRPDGRVLEWKTLVLKDTRGGLLPFFIEWSAGSVHPSADAPRGCRLAQFEVAAPDRDEFARMYALLGLEVNVVRGEHPQLRTTFVGPGGEMVATTNAITSLSTGVSPASPPVDGAHPYSPGRDGIKDPVCVYCPSPFYTKEARSKHLQGKVLVELTVLPNGNTSDVRVVRGLGMGLDEAAVEAVRKWRFKPFVGPSGQPVPVQFISEVSFRAN